MTTVAQLEDSIRALPVSSFLELMDWMNERHLDVLKSEDGYESAELEAEMLKALDSPRRPLDDALLDSIRGELALQAGGSKSLVEMRRLDIQQSDAATEDLRLQSTWYDVHAGPDIAERYLSAFLETAQQLAQQPDLGRKRHFRDPRLARLRSFAIQRVFNKHLIFYRIEGDTLTIFRVLHGMRDLPRRLLQPPGAEED